MHVARGAVLTRLHGGEFIIRRPITRSKAITTWLPLTAEIRQRSNFYDMLVIKKGRDGLEYFYAAQWLAKGASLKFST